MKTITIMMTIKIKTMIRSTITITTKSRIAQFTPAWSEKVSGRASIYEHCQESPKKSNGSREAIATTNFEKNFTPCSTYRCVGFLYDFEP